MKIPSRFELGGRTWHVERGVKGKRWYGHCSSTKCLIRLSTKNKTRREELHTFLHELLHAVKFTMGHKRHNEVKIDAMASLLLQALTTSS